MEKKQYTQEDLDRILDELHKGVIGTRTDAQWATSLRQKGVVQSQLFTEKAKENHKKNLAQKTKQWRESRKKYLTGRPNPEQSKAMTGKGNPKYGTGNTYIEVTTGFKGTATDMRDKFGISALNLSAYAKRDRPMQSGKCKGLYFKII